MINILGINISSDSPKEAWAKIQSFLDSSSQHYLVTPNPEIVLAAQNDEEYFHILNQADLALPDGMGLKLAAGLLGKKLGRITGSDLTPKLLELAQAKGYPVLIINWKQGLSSSQDISQSLSEKYPRLSFEVWDQDRENWNIKETKAKICFCALGAPYQEKFIWHNLKKMPSVKLALGIGGSFDFLTGKAQRAPKLMRRFGLEWLYRVIKRPQRIKRIYNATVVFSLKVINWRFILPFKYRPNVACLLYQFKNQQPYILLVERTDEPGHWQLPQGGTDGLDLKAAATKELSEETGNNKFAIRAVYQNLYRYQTSFKNQRHSGYRGQKQGLAIAEFTGQESDIKTNYWDHSGHKWVKADELLSACDPIRRESYEIYLKKFNDII